MSAAKEAVGNTYIARRTIRLPQIFPTIVYVCLPQPAADEDLAVAREVKAREMLEGLNLVVSCEACRQLHLGMHRFYVDLADVVLVVNRGGRLTEEQRREIEYATATRKTIRYVEET